MAKILKNYKRTGESIESFPVIKIKNDDDVFADLPICLVEYDTHYNKPVLITYEGKVPEVIEAAVLVKTLEGTRMFYLELDEDNNLKEVEQDNAMISVRLPKDTNVDELVFINGEILKQEVVK